MTTLTRLAHGSLIDLDMREILSLSARARIPATTQNFYPLVQGLLPSLSSGQEVSASPTISTYLGADICFSADHYVLYHGSYNRLNSQRSVLRVRACNVTYRIMIHIVAQGREVSLTRSCM